MREESVITALAYRDAMTTSDEHLEQALREYNEKVNALEDGGSPRELLDAYIHRGCVLYMMGSYVSAATDFGEAVGIITRIENSGGSVDPGYFVKAYTSRGMLEIDKSAEAMADDYRIAATRLKDLKDGSKYYGEKDIVEMCLDCGSDLTESEMAEDALPFAEKALSLLVGKDDAWHRNRYAETCALEGQIYMDTEDFVRAAEMFDEAVRVAEDLLEEGSLEDVMELVNACVFRGDLAENADDTEGYLRYMNRAIDLMEDLMEKNRLDDVSVLAELHGEVAQVYMKANDMKTAEKHLLRQVSINLSGADDYMSENGIDGSGRDD